MTPEVSRRAGRILGSSGIAFDEKDQIVKAVKRAATWSDIPDDARHRLEQLEAVAGIPQVSRGIQRSQG